MDSLLWLALVLGWIVVCRLGPERPPRWQAGAIGVLAVGKAILGIFQELTLWTILLATLLFAGLGFGTLRWLHGNDGLLAFVLVLVLGTAALFFGLPLLESALEAWQRS